MSSHAGLDAISALSHATRVAQAHSHVDIHSTVRQCAANQTHIFVVPVRYALSTCAVSHPAIQPGIGTQSHPLAARLLRTGYVYVWQGAGPLKRYAVAENNLLRAQYLEDDDTVVMKGTLSGIELGKHQDAWMLYAEYPLNMAHCQQLSDASIRGKRMRRLDLRSVANTLQAPHCAPVSDYPRVMGELNPQVYDRALAVDHQQNAQAYEQGEQQLIQQIEQETDPQRRQVLIDAYVDARRWNNERSMAAARQAEIAPGTPPVGEWSAEPWAPLKTLDVLALAHIQAKGLYSVFACLDDDLGVLRDINHEQELLESRHEQWQADNNLRLSIGGFIRSLITEDATEVSESLNYRYREHDIQLTPEQARQMLEARTRLEALARERYTANIRRSTTHSNHEADTRLHEIHLREQAAVAPIRAFIPLELHADALNVVRDYQESKVNNLRNTQSSDKVAQYIDLEAMNTWLDQTAPAHFSHLQQRHHALYADREQYLKRSESGTWFVNYLDPDNRRWLDQLALSCLSAQCLRQHGAEQFAHYIRSDDQGALRQVFTGWNPSLEGAVNSVSRSAELIAALDMENQTGAKSAIAKVLGVVGLPVVNHLALLAQDAQGQWNTLVKRLGAALLLLQNEHGSAPGGSWLSILIAAKLGNGVGLRAVNEGGLRTWHLFGKTAEDLIQWVNSTAKAIGTGNTAKIVNSPAVINGSGLVAIAALLINGLNASNYLAQASVVEEMDSQRLSDTLSATLYASSALVAVLGSYINKEAIFSFRFSSMPVMTMLGAVLGGLSLFAAFYELRSLKEQLEKMHDSVDPWLKLRGGVVSGQMIVFGAQAINGAFNTYRSVIGGVSARGAILRYSVWMGPINYLMAVLGVLYLVAWYLQQTPMQDFLDSCCWSRRRSRDLKQVSFEEQRLELNSLYRILYAPRVSFESVESKSVMSSLQSGDICNGIKTLTVDLPGAEPTRVELDFAMIGNPTDIRARRERIKNNITHLRYEELMQDIGGYWLGFSRCEWIPYGQGQGLRLIGQFKVVPELFGSLPTKVNVRLRYVTPLIRMFGADNFIGGNEGITFAISASSGVVGLRHESISELEAALRRSVGKHNCSVYLDPDRE